MLNELLTALRSARGYSLVELLIVAILLVVFIAVVFAILPND